MTLHITDQVLMSEWKNTLFLVDFHWENNWQFWVLWNFPVDTLPTLVYKYRLMKKLMKTPKIPSSTAPKQLPMPDESNSILSSVQHHSLNSGSSTQRFSCSFQVPSLCKGQRKSVTSCFLPDTPVSPVFCYRICAKIWLLQGQNLLKLCSMVANKSFPVSREFQLSVFLIRNCWTNTNVSNASSGGNCQLQCQTGGGPAPTDTSASPGVPSWAWNLPAPPKRFINTVGVTWGISVFCGLKLGPAAAGCLTVLQLLVNDQTRPQKEI